MERLDMIREGENGQLYIDFDALELVTSSEFVERVKGVFNEDTVVSFRVEVLRSAVRVYLLTDYGRFYIFAYNRDSNFYRVNKIFDSDLSVLLEMREEVLGE